MVPLPTEQGADVTAGAGGGAVPDVRGVHCYGAVAQDAGAGGPGDHDRVTATLQGGLQVGLGARPCRQRESVSVLSVASNPI